VTIPYTVRGLSVRASKYLDVDRELADSTVTFAELSDEIFLDWFTHHSTGVDSPAFLETGYSMFGDTQRVKQILYLITHFGRTETGYNLDVNSNPEFTNGSSCLLRVKWEFSDSPASGRWSQQFQAYRLQNLYIPDSENDPFDYGFSVVTTKNKVRGKGRALRIRFDSEPGKDLYMLGWGMTIGVKGSV